MIDIAIIRVPETPIMKLLRSAAEYGRKSLIFSLVDHSANTSLPCILPPGIEKDVSDE